MTIEKLQVLITAQTRDLRRQLSDVKQQLGSVEAKAKSTSNGINKAFKAIKITAVVAALTTLGKKAIETASELEEVQNVVDTTFGDAAERVERFSKAAITQFGLSEYAAKKAASGFMAMSNGMGVARDAGAEMAIQLAGLSGDLASFWNTNTEQAMTALNGIYTGETEALKKYGVVMTEATLSSYAMAIGVKKQYNELSQAEKVLLRYKFVLNSTEEAQGDFAKTSNSWANQVRILKEQFNSLLGILGKGFIEALTPVVRMLNQLLNVVINIANAWSAAWSKAFGTDKQTMSVDTKPADKNIEQTTQKVDKLKKELQLMSFDEINQLKKVDNEKDEAQNNNNIDPALKIEVEKGDGGIAEELEKQYDLIDEILQRILDKFKEIKDKLPKLNISIDEELLAENIKRLIFAFIEAFGNIIAAALEFGINLANSINFDAVVTNLTNAGVSLLHAFETIVVTIIQLANRIAEDIQLGLVIEKVTEVIAAFANFADQLVSAIAPACIAFYETGLSPIVQWIGEKLVDALNFAVEILDDWAAWFQENAPLIEQFAEKLGEVVAGLWALIEPLLDVAWETFKEAIRLITEIIQAFFTFILENGEVVGSLIMGVITAFASFKVVQAVISIVKGCEAAIIALKAAFVAFLTGNPIALAIAAVAGLIVAFTALWQNCEGFRNFWIGLWDGIVSVVQGAWEGICSIIDGIIQAVQNAVDAVKEFFGLGGGDKGGGNGFSASSRSRSSGFRMAPANIPALANGGALYGPQTVLAGEYAGASTNPEIVAPQSLMRETMENANAGVINAIMAMGEQVTKAVEEKDTNVYMDATKLTRKVMQTEQTLSKRQGTSLINH